ncbi:hypothetical protein PHYBLDRAFT_62915 [Phycomyces blakesleeanus NRRL 1555(-)]|uniref:Uncharacterized protein n=1 Tax=Phycomyces blakesleeanus (strain ATCC 8743b / DSM 1359 / FGSC 10004 / NBRC 33097 / NRRL 1555) TaxID=763407 RepID=A0A163E5Z2_PHYB8|nr:hypothetical protein PHYBLDRAFT_62915 [Phycomyces blakesleeanus NRRL 1555(-)]OAD76900.1 hypothetical protein PHYBLDRAFT_62915 [Phycomyces blakesleeanus NRRL 1555(-)]|eukprot:XP_018294940.1 hypothetical protein PHYBLDRAFT_62915 [Phycomyces blakesleeanus NRRL 1555(-)]
MPGPKEPKTEEINHYLKPIVDELLQLLMGITILTFECPAGVKVRAALHMVACDISAARKTSGFTTHNSTCACPRCVRQFTRLPSTNQVDFTVWKTGCMLRSGRVPVRPQKGISWKIENGVRWSQLHRLEYFDLVRGTIIDPMHNLFLGTPKRMMERWIKERLIDNRKLATMQAMAETMVVPMDYVVLKSKIRKGFPYMKADEWKSWVLVYSPILLKAVLPIEMFRNWISFVDACCQLVKPSITFSDIDDGHKFLQEFCTECQRIYTPTILTCNMHLHLHLCKTIRDFEPVYGYWLFGFERYNCLLKNVNTNRKDSFEVTYMNSFVQDTFKGDFVHAALTCPSQVPFLPLLAKLTATAQPSTSKNTITFPQHPFRLSVFIQAYSNPSLPVLGNEPLSPSTFPLHIEPPSAMSDVDYPHLLDYYKVAYCMPNLEGYQHPSSPFSFVDNQIIKLKSINLLGQVYKGCKYASGRGSFVQSLFLGSQGNNRLAYTGQIQYLFLHSFTPPVDNTELQTRVVYQDKHVFAFVKWFQIEHDHSRELESVDICSADFIACDFE